MNSPTARTLASLRREGWICAVVEHWNPHARVRQDLFGALDLIAVRADEKGVLGVQACSGTDHAKRRDKLLAEPRMVTWLAAGNRLEIWSWAKQGPRGKRKLWTCRREAVILADGKLHAGTYAIADQALP